MNRTMAIVTTLVVVLLGALAVAMFHATFERRDELEETGYRGAARQNPLLAVERFAARMGVPAAALTTLVDVPPPDAAILLTAPREYFGPLRHERILAFVRRGGHLLVTPAEPARAGGADPILDELGLGVVELVPDDEDEPDERPLSATAAGREFALHTAARHALADPLGVSAWSVADGEHVAIARVPLGRGFVTVLADDGWLRNEHIGAADHAALLWSVLTAPGVPPSLLIVRHDDLPSLPVLVLTHGTAAVVAALLLLALALWRASRRFGPLLPEPDLARRSLREHLDAAGRFLWRSGAREALLEGPRRALELRLVQRRPDWPRLDRRTRVRCLSEVGGLAPDAVEAALAANAPADPHAFTRIVHDLETLRNAR